jgi:hypothetical protein
MSMRVVTGKVRLSFPYLFEPRPAAKEGDQPKFSVMLLIPKSDKVTMKALREAESEAKEIGKTSKWSGKIPANLTSIIKDGDEDGTAEDYPEREGHYYMTVGSDPKYRPGVVDRRVQPIMDQSEVYSGVYAKVSITAFPFNKNGNKGVSFGLNNVQVLGGGESLGGGKRAEEEFEAAEEEFDDSSVDESLL